MPLSCGRGNWPFNKCDFVLCCGLKPSPLLFFDLEKLSTCLFGSDQMLFKGCPDSRLTGSILFVSIVPLCSIVSKIHAWLGLAGTKTKRIFIFWPDHSNALPPSSSFSAHKREKGKGKKEKRKGRNLCKEKGQAWFCATARVIFIL